MRICTAYDVKCMNVKCNTDANGKAWNGMWFLYTDARSVMLGGAHTTLTVRFRIFARLVCICSSICSLLSPSAPEMLLSRAVPGFVTDMSYCPALKSSWAGSTANWIVLAMPAALPCNMSRHADRWDLD